MSFNITQEVLRNVPGDRIKMPAKLCLACLATYASEDQRQCYPSISQLTLMMGCDRRTVMTAIKKLQKEGFIGVERHRGEVNKYTLRADYTPIPARQITLTPQEVEVDFD